MWLFFVLPTHGKMLILIFQGVLLSGWMVHNQQLKNIWTISTSNYPDDLEGEDNKKSQDELVIIGNICIVYNQQLNKIFTISTSNYQNDLEGDIIRNHSMRFS